ncbi:MAG: 4-hydroxythreonine-4-phosphate dehydrogenase PdxA [Candidatus Omnitrophica bacterium]|nr:4-hydroxythreonine-4-phosphate dehydrogenase PdxA [Candidatus Omnitrophota bacterium]
MPILKLRETMRGVKIGITMGDPAGIGPEVIAKAISSPDIKKLGRIFLIGDKWIFNKIKNKKLKIKNVEFIDLKNVPRKNFKFGKVRRAYGRASMEYLFKAVELIKNRKIDCLVTAPISKQSIRLGGFSYSGHTEFLAAQFTKNKDSIVMMLLNKYLKISLVTRHLSLKKVAPSLNQNLIYKTILITYDALRNYFGLIKPHIAVAALNPHSGESGLLGSEEIKKIAPAVEKARRLVKNIAGPIAADWAFSCARAGKFDAVIAMYHDQALIPLKITSPESGVNMTLGLGFVRTSPLHGTGFDIAGRNIAEGSSFRAAIKAAVDSSSNLIRSKKVKTV